VKRQRLQRDKNEVLESGITNLEGASFLALQRDALLRYDWPGNLRESQNFVERAVILSSHTVLRAPTSELEPFRDHKSPNMTMTGLEEVERDHILRAVEASNWVVGGRNGAADRLGMERTPLVYRMRKFQISRPASAP
jgi:formate hydrogenlyase transcriptional activator